MSSQTVLSVFMLSNNGWFDDSSRIEHLHFELTDLELICTICKFSALACYVHISIISGDEKPEDECGGPETEQTKLLMAEIAKLLPYS